MTKIFLYENSKKKKSQRKIAFLEEIPNFLLEKIAFCQSTEEYRKHPLRARSTTISDKVCQ
jgi:hypothetical protein